MSDSDSSSESESGAEDGGGGENNGKKHLLFLAVSDEAKALRTHTTYKEKFSQIIKFVRNSAALRLKQKEAGLPKLERCSDHTSRIIVSQDVYKNIAPPLGLDLVMDFFQFIQKSPKGKLKSFSTMKGFKSAISHYYEQNGVRMPVEEVDAIKKYNKGFNHVVAKGKRDGEIETREGKDYLRLTDLSRLAIILITRSGHPDADQALYLMSWSFILMQWNSMQRVNTTSCYVYDAFDWSNDHFTLQIEQMKNDPDGLRVYKRAIVPDELGESVTKSRCIYNTGADNRFIECLTSQLKNKNNKFEAANSKDTGSHSIRKGALTYVNGCLDGPISTAVLLRGGYKISNTLNRYILAGLGQDELVGRLLSQLDDWGEVTFSQLPAHFKADDVNSNGIYTDDGTIIPWDQIIGANTFPPCFLRCLPYFLARIVYSLDFLQDSAQFPCDSIFFRSTLWTSGILENLKGKVRSGFSHDRECKMTASGVPSNIKINKKLDNVRDLIEEGFANLPSRVVDTCREEKLINDNEKPATLQDVERVVSAAFRNNNNSNITSNGSTVNTSFGHNFGPSLCNLDPIHRFYWGNDWHPVPEYFFSKSQAHGMELRHVFSSWWPKELSKQSINGSFTDISGYRFIKSKDIFHDDVKVSSARRREWCRLCRCVEILITEGLIKPGAISSSLTPVHHPDIIKLSMSARQDLYCIAFKNICGIEPNEHRKTLSYSRFYDLYNQDTHLD